MSRPLPIATADRDERAAAIRSLNDGLRQTFTGGRVVVTAGIAALAPEVVVAIVAAVKRFDRFDGDNDPHGEHDFGAVTAGGVRVFWKIDYFDRSLERLSPNPADPAVTVRVLTVMLPEEW